MSEKSLTRDLEDEWGIVVQKQGTNGRRFNWKRITKEGFSFKIYRPKTKDYKTALAAAHIALAKNEMNDEIMVNSKRLTDEREAIIFNNLFDLGLNSRQRMRETILECAHVNSYHPIKNYLDRLIWDGIDRLKDLLDHFSFKDNPEWSRSVMTKWFVGTVAKIYTMAQLFMLVLDGPQGSGKSYLVRWLCPLTEYFIEGPINPGYKDTDLASIASWIWEVSELQATTRRADREALKAHITKQTVSVRKPYGRYSMTKPVTASYLGTINQDAGFLEDDSGNRRFVIVSLKEIDWSYINIDCDQLWAQIVAMYKDSYEWNLSTQEEHQRDTINKIYDAPHPVIELFLEYYTYDPGVKIDHFIPTINIITNLEKAGLKGNQRANMMKLTSWLKARNCHQDRTFVNGSRQRGFYGMVQTKELEEESKWYP